MKVQQLSVLIILQLFFLALSCENDYQDIHTVIEIESVETTSNVDVIKIIKDRFAKSGFQNVVVEKNEIPNQYLVEAKISESEKKNFNLIFRSDNFDLWHTFNNIDRKIQSIDLAKVTVDGFTPTFNNKSSYSVNGVLGMCRDSTKLNSILKDLEANLIGVKNLKLIWSKRIENYGGGDIYQLHMINTEGKLLAPITEADIIKASAVVDSNSGQNVINFQFDEQATLVWAQMTEEALYDGSRCIAIVLNDKVISSPRVNGAITGGRSALAGEFTKEESSSLAKRLSRARLPFELRVISQQVIEVESN